MNVKPVSQYNYKSKQNTSFGTIIPIEKVLINGEKTENIKDIKLAAKYLKDVMFKQIEHKDGDSIRKFIQSIATDYKIPAGGDLKYIPAEIATSTKGKAYLFVGKHFQRVNSHRAKLIDSLDKLRINIVQYHELLAKRFGQMVEGKTQKNNKGLSVHLLKTDDSFALSEIQFA